MLPKKEAIIPNGNMIVVDARGKKYVCNYSSSITHPFDKVLPFCSKCNRSTSTYHKCKKIVKDRQLKKANKCGKSQQYHQSSRKSDIKENLCSKKDGINLLVKSKDKAEFNFHDNLQRETGSSTTVKNDCQVDTGLSTFAKNNYIVNSASTSSTFAIQSENSNSIMLDLSAEKMKEKLGLPTKRTLKRKRQNQSCVDKGQDYFNVDIGLIIKLLETINVSKEHLGFIGASIKTLISQAKSCKVEKKSFDKILRDNSTYCVIKVCHALMDKLDKNSISENQMKQIKDSAYAIDELLKQREKIMKIKLDIPLLVNVTEGMTSNNLSYFLKAFMGYHGLPVLELGDFVTLCHKILEKQRMLKEKNAKPNCNPIVQSEVDLKSVSDVGLFNDEQPKVPVIILSDDSNNDNKPDANIEEQTNCSASYNRNELAQMVDNFLLFDTEIQDAIKSYVNQLLHNEETKAFASELNVIITNLSCQNNTRNNRYQYR